MKYQIVTVDHDDLTTRQRKIQAVPTDMNPLAFVGRLVKGKVQVIGFRIFSDEMDPVMTVSYHQGEQWAIYDHKDQDTVRMTLTEMEAL